MITTEYTDTIQRLTEIRDNLVRPQLDEYTGVIKPELRAAKTQAEFEAIYVGAEREYNEAYSVYRRDRDDLEYAIKYYQQLDAVERVKAKFLC